MFYSELRQFYAVFVDGFIRGRAESYEFLRNDPIKVAVLKSFVVFVLCQAKGFIVEPSDFDGVLEASYAVKNLYVTFFTVHL